MRIETGTIRRLCDALLTEGRRPSLMDATAPISAVEAASDADQAEALGRIDALGETLFLMVAADGSLQSAERDALVGAIREVTEGLVRRSAIEGLLVRYQERLDQEGRDARLSDIAAALVDDPTQAEAAFAMAAAVALADDRVDARELGLIHEVAQRFEIAPERAEHILGLIGDDRQGG